MSLRETFDGFWKKIRQSQPFAGQPRNESSSSAVALAQEALRLATEDGDADLLLDAWRMLAYSLTANEQYAEAIPWYAQALQQCESTGNGALATKVRIGEPGSEISAYSVVTIIVFPSQRQLRKLPPAFETF